MNSGSNLPNNNYILRHVKKSQLRRDGDNNVIGILGQALEMRGDEDTLSVCWLEYFNGNYNNQVFLTAIVKNTARNIKKNDAFAIANTDKIRELSTNKGYNNLRIVFAPEKDYMPNHSELRKYPKEDSLFFELLAEEAFTDLVINSDLILPI